ncbi:DUF6527 family protein [Roseovarius pacificus]|uniref:DUF6527 family protein n=1 Tax=Roseovarius pacificus TaxID=337701 RepID=UPI00403A02FF
MSALGTKLRRAEGGRIMFWCPGCNGVHAVIVDGSRGWTFDGNEQAPTFAPSVLVRGTEPITDDEHARIMAGEKITPKPAVCHTFVRAGRIQFLNDCTHDLAGQTVDLPDWPTAHAGAGS